MVLDKNSHRANLELIHRFMFIYWTHHELISFNYSFAYLFIYLLYIGL